MGAGLPRQTVPILLRGLDQAQPRQAAVWGTLSLLSNMVLEKQGDGYEFFPRPGSAALTKTADAGTISAGMKLGTLGAGLLLLTGSSCYRKATDQWHRVEATAPLVGVDTKQIVGDSLNCVGAGAVYVNGFTVTAAIVSTTSTTRSLVATAIDSTGATVVSSILQTGDLQAVKVIAAGTRAVIFWELIPGVIRASRFDSAAPSSFGAAINVTTTARTVPFVYGAQIVPSSGSIAVIWRDQATDRLAQLLLPPSTMTPGGITTYAGITAQDTFNYLTNDYSTNVIYVGHVDSTNGLRVTTFNGATLALTGTTVFDAASVLAFNLSGYRAGASVSVYFTGIGSPQNAYNYRIMLSTGAAATRIRGSLSLASDVLSANGTLYALARYNGDVLFSTPQSGVLSTYFLVDLVAQKEVAKALPDLAGPNVIQSLTLPSFGVGATANTWITAGHKMLGFSTDATVPVSYLGAVQLTFTNQDITIGKPVELNNGLHIPGGWPMLYDGSTLVEEGFPIGPEVSASATPAAGGSMTPNSTYSYAHIFAWPDAAGNIHRSNPTAEFQVALGAADTQVTHSIPTLRITRKTGVIIETYRKNATAGGTTLTRVSSVSAPTINDTSVDAVTFVDTVSDVVMQAGEPIYTTGGVLEDIAPPPCRSFAVHKGRMLVGGVDGDDKSVWFSKDVVPGFGVAFSDFLVSRLSSTEAVKSVGTMDAFAVACTATGTWASSDEYPDDLGNGGVLRFQQYSTVTGCTTVGLAGRTDQGTFVYAGPSKGVWRMSRGLQFDYVGANVEDDVFGMTPTAVLTVPSRNEVRVIGGTRVLVYESVHGTWARWDYADTPGGFGFVDAAMWNGVPVYLCSDGTVIQESTSSYDDVNHVPHRATFSGLNPAGVAGFARLYITQITGRVVGDNDTQMTLTADQSFDGVAIAAKSLVLPNGTTDLNFEVDPGTMGKCSRFDLSVYDNATTTGNTGFSIAAATVLVGTKKGLNKLPPARRAT